MSRYRYLALPAYLVATALILIPIVDAALSLWPWRPAVAQWRFGAIGLASNAMMIPAAGLLIVLATALVLGHWRVLRTLGVVSAIAAFCVGASILLFTLDALQTRANVAAAGRMAFTVASVTAFGKLVLATLTLVGIALAGLRTQPDRQRASGTGPIVKMNAEPSASV